MAVSQSVSTAIAGIQLSAGEQASAPQAPAATPTSVPIQTVEVGDSPSWGPADPKLTVIEFSDFQCPYCEIFNRQTYPQLKERYSDKIRFVYKHFPLTSIHDQAYPSALASECAREQGKFWEYHDILFQNQSNLFDAALLDYAAQVGVSDIEQFQQCFSDAKYADRVEADFNAAISHFATGTPTFFINGKLLAGAYPYEIFVQEIEAALAGG